MDQPRNTSKAVSARERPHLVGPTGRAADIVARRRIVMRRLSEYRRTIEQG